MMESLESLSPLVAILLLFVSVVALFLKFLTKQSEKSQKIAEGFQETIEKTTEHFQAAAVQGHQFGMEAAKVIGENTQVLKSFADTQIEIKVALLALKKN